MIPDGALFLGGWRVAVGRPHFARTGTWSAGCGVERSLTRPRRRIAYDLLTYPPVCFAQIALGLTKIARTHSAGPWGTTAARSASEIEFAPIMTQSDTASTKLRSARTPPAATTAQAQKPKASRR